ncbi:amino acid adenylation domain-containing protein [Streptomyces sp. 5-8]|uniref:Amino acid adenylation domain-containing protein n=1 Tax=Streptomyces musisoli TaxID=2802280 RepID=A0ABS1P902_9ACTN|nr:MULTISPECIES: non-ribosomal peptide synthetase [Streptomyces]MBL1108828.1 amino acid adenylation domain-containing protein [Streptomyces musisoli]MBY8842956.1 amino acid adenylation domain-containing protein [Streptomyces sp. SP2-10]
MTHTTKRAGVVDDDLRERIARLPAEQRALLRQRMWEKGAATGLPGTDDAGEAPASFTQRRMALLAGLDPDSPAYNSPVVHRLTGPLDVRALEGALDDLLARHAVLRTVLPVREGRTVQRVLPHRQHSLAVVDLTGLPERERLARAERIALADAAEPFDLAADAPVRFRLLRLAADDALLVLVFHHAVVDGWSLGVLLSDLAEAYGARLDGRTPELPALTVDYAEYARWQQEWADSAEAASQLDYWERRLAGAPDPMPLPADRPRPPKPDGRAESTVFTLPADVRDALKRTSARTGTTLFMVLLAGFQIVLARHGGHDDVVVGTPVANRRYRGFHDIVGFFANSLPLRSRIHREATFEDFLAEVRTTCLEAYENQDVPLDLIAQRLNPDRAPGRNPVYQVNFTLHNTPPRPVRTLPGGVGVTELDHLDHDAARFDLDLNIWETGAGLECRLIHARDLFDTATGERLARSLTVLLAAVAADPAARIGELPLMPAEETERTLRSAHGTRVARPADLRVERLIAARARACADEVAVSAPGRPDLTYRELDHRANGLARRLSALGAGPGSVVAVLLPRTPEAVIALLAVLKSGAAYVALDAAYPKARLDHMLRDSGATLVLAEARLRDLARGPGVRVVTVDPETVEREAAGTPPEADVTPDDLMYLMYTSGSTGGPKGAMLSHRQVANYLLWAVETYLPPGADGAVPVHSSLSFDLTVTSLFAPLLAGGRLLFAGDSGTPGEALRASAAADTGLAFVKLTPSHLRMLEDSGAPARAAAWTRTMVVGGEELDEERLAAWRTAPGGPRIVNEYGPTETAVACAAHHSVHPVDGFGRIPIGTPVHNTRLYVLDESMNPVPPGAPGELYVGGAGVCHGYWNRPGPTAERFVPDPFGDEPGGRLYRTGDRVRRLATGDLEYLGRLDDQVKIRGHRVEPDEVAAALAQDPAVRDAAVIAHGPTPQSRRLVAFVSPRTDEAGASATAAASDWVDRWQTLYDDTYGSAERPADPSFDLAGWNSSYTGEPIDTAGMGEWLDATVDRIRSLRPGRALEIGCGTGLILSRVAPDCTYYQGVDLSERVIDNLREALDARPGGAERIVLRAGPAHRAVRPGETYDTVILNSVVQYFPSVDYLFEVLDQAIDAMPDGGHVFLGDLRSLVLLEAFHASVAAHRARPGTPDTALRAETAWRMEAENELCLDPRLFAALPAGRPRVESVRVLLKRGTAGHELNCYRYDVVITVAAERTATAAAGPAAAPASAAPEWRDWRAEGLGLGALAALLETGRPDRLALRGIPNARLDGDLRLLARLSGAAPDAVAPGVDPEELCALAERHGYRTEPSWAAGHPDGSFDVLLYRAGLDPEPLPPAGAAVPTDRIATRPLWRPAALAALPAVEARLRDRLPDPLLPSRYVVLRRIPLNANGKVDRAALTDLLAVSKTPAEEGTGRDPGAEREPELTPTERRMAAIWSELLGRDGIRAQDDFFDLGGHSLLTFRLVFRLREEFEVEVPVRGPFDASTLGALSCLVDGLTAEAQPPALPALAPVERAESTQASFAQERLWFLHQLDPDTAQYNFPVFLRLTGELDVDLLRRSVTEIVRRHEVLRTVITSRDGMAYQTVLPCEPVPLPVTDLTGYPPEQRAEEARRLAREQYAQPFDLAAGPVLRTGLLRLGTTDHVLLLTAHHVSVDGWSAAVLRDELAELYTAAREGRPHRLPELPVQYADYAIWQRRLAEAGHFDRLVEHWTRRLQGILDLPGLPLDRPRPADPRHRGEGVRFRIPASTADGVRTLCRQEDSTLFMALLAALYAVVNRRTGETDLVVGSDVAGRSDTKTEPLIGFFVNQIVLRADLTGAPTWRELLGRTKALALDAYAHQDLPFEEVVKALSPPRTRNQSPLFQIKFVLNSNRRPADTMAGLELSPFSVALIDTSRFDITLVLEEDDEGLAGFLNYDPDLFDASTMAELREQYLALVADMAARPDASIADAPLPTTAPPVTGGTAPGRVRRRGPGTLRGITPTRVAMAPNDVVVRETLGDGADLPLVLRPAHPDVDPVTWARAHRDRLDTDLERHGALLFRGFGITHPDALERFASVFVDDLFGENGEHPRAALGGKVYTPVFFPPEEKLLWHNENSFNDEGPTRIWFCCARPAESGGETPVVDSRAVHRRLDPALRQEFTAKGVMYIRTYGTGLGLDWRSVFRAGDRAEAEARCARQGLRYEWHGDRLRTTAVRPAVLRHPRTGEWSWFNQAQHWHTACLSASVRDSLLATMSPEELPRTCRFGDGTPIPDEAMHEILRVYRELEISFPWERGDVMLLDNILTAHARNPFHGERELLVAMGGMVRFQ